jgi:hypothetical protein
MCNSLHNPQFLSTQVAEFEGLVYGPKVADAKVSSAGFPGLHLASTSPRNPELPFLFPKEIKP